MEKFVNNFIDSPPFGLYDIFNYLIYHSTAYDKQGLAAYKSFEDYRLFEDGYVESLLTKDAPFLVTPFPFYYIWLCTCNAQFGRMI